MILRDALTHTEQAIQEAEAAALGHSESNRLLQNVIIVAMRQVRALSAQTRTLTPELQACLIVHRPQVFLNASGMEPSARALASDPTGNSSTHALRSEMHSLRVLDTEVAALKKAIDTCATCSRSTWRTCQWLSSTQPPQCPERAGSASLSEAHGSRSSP